MGLHQIVSSYGCSPINIIDMKYRRLIAVVLFVIYGFMAFGFYGNRGNTQKSENGAKRLPLIVKYLGKEPPDSIQQFVITLLRMNKIDVINEKQGMELMFEQVQGTMQDWIKSDKLKGVKSESDPKMEELRNEMLKPVYDRFRIKFFSFLDNTEVYQIDSIQWQVSQVPDKDTVFVPNLFLPEKNDSNDVYTVVKKMVTVALKLKN